MDDLHKKSSIFLYKIVEKNIDFQGVKSKIKESKKSGLTKSQTERKGGSETNSLTDVLKEELNCETVFTIPIGKGIPVFESVVVTWVIMAVLVVLSLILVRNLKLFPGNPGRGRRSVYPVHDDSNYLSGSFQCVRYLWCKAAYKGLECYAGTCSYEYVSH